MLHHIKITLALCLASFGATCQEKEDCMFIKAVYLEQIQKTYNDTYVSDSLVLFEVGIEEEFISHFQQEIPRRILRKLLIASNTSKQNINKLECPSDFLTYDKDSTIKRIRRINVELFIKDSSFVKEVDQRQEEIFKIADETQRHKELNKLTQTPEFERYSDVLDFYRPRLIEFSMPVFVGKFCFVRANILKNYSDDRYSILYAYQKDNSLWRLLSKWQVVE